jgi:hypothetical protein
MMVDATGDLPTLTSQLTLQAQTLTALALEHQERARELIELAERAAKGVPVKLNDGERKHIEELALRSWEIKNEQQQQNNGIRNSDSGSSLSLGSSVNSARSNFGGRSRSPLPELGHAASSRSDGGSTSGSSANGSSNSDRTPTFSGAGGSRLAGLPAKKGNEYSDEHYQNNSGSGGHSLDGNHGGSPSGMKLHPINGGNGEGRLQTFEEQQLQLQIEEEQQKQQRHQQRRQQQQLQQQGSQGMNQGMAQGGMGGGGGDDENGGYAMQIVFGAGSELLLQGGKGNHKRPSSKDSNSSLNSGSSNSSMFLDLPFEAWENFLSDDLDPKLY